MLHGIFPYMSFSAISLAGAIGRSSGRTPLTKPTRSNESIPQSLWRRNILPSLLRGYLSALTKVMAFDGDITVRVKNGDAAQICSRIRCAKRYPVQRLMRYTKFIPLYEGKARIMKPIVPL